MRNRHCQQNEQLRPLATAAVDGHHGKGETGPKGLGTLFEKTMDGQQPPPVGGWVEGVDGVPRNGV